MSGKPIDRDDAASKNTASSLLNPVARVWHRSEKLRFLMVGALNTSVGYLLFVIIFLLLHDQFHYLGVLVLSHLFAVVFSFGVQRRLVFRSTERACPQFLRFSLNQLGVITGGLVLLPVLVEGLHLHPIVGQAIVVVAAASLGYPLHKHLSFGVCHDRNE